MVLINLTIDRRLVKRLLSINRSDEVRAALLSTIPNHAPNTHASACMDAARNVKREYPHESAQRSQKTCACGRSISMSMVL